MIKVEGEVHLIVAVVSSQMIMLDNAKTEVHVLYYIY